MDLPEGMTPDKLRTLASWFDTYDRLAVVHFTMCINLKLMPPEDYIAVQKIVRGSGVQEDLRRWASEIEAAS